MDDDLRPASRLDIAAAAALLSEPARVSIISALMDGQARPATELARIARGLTLDRERAPGAADARRAPPRRAARETSLPPARERRGGPGVREPLPAHDPAVRSASVDPGDAALPPGAHLLPAPRG